LEIFSGKWIWKIGDLIGKKEILRVSTAQNTIKHLKNTSKTPENTSKTQKNTSKTPQKQCF
jgi:hypothetical protein